MAKRFKYTSKLQSETQGGSASVLMAGISVFLFLLSAIVSYIFEGKAGNFVGAAGLAAMLLAISGFIVGLHSFSEKDKSHRFSTAGALANGVIAVGWLALYLIGVG